MCKQSIITILDLGNYITVFIHYSVYTIPINYQGINYFIIPLKYYY